MNAAWPVTGMPAKTLAAVTLVVVAAHAWVLQGTAVELEEQKSAAARAFTTRTISPAPRVPEEPGTEKPVVKVGPTPPRAPPTKASPPKSPEAHAVTVAQPEPAEPAPAGDAMVASAPSTPASSALPALSDGPVEGIPDPQPDLKLARADDVIDPPPAAKMVETTEKAPDIQANSPSAPEQYTSLAINTVAILTQKNVPPTLPSGLSIAQPGGTSIEIIRGKTVLPTRVPPPALIKYKVTGNKDGLRYFASAQLEWRHDGVRYDARMAVSAFLIGSRVRTSTGRLGELGLQPERFSDKFRSELAAHFDYGKQRITFSNGPETPLLAGAQDQLSVFMQLGALIAAAPDKYPLGTTFSVQTVGPRSADPWILKLEKEETLDLPGGQLATTKLVRNPRREYDQKAELWLSSELGYLPARIRITQPAGDWVDQQWSETATEPAQK